MRPFQVVFHLRDAGGGCVQKDGRVAGVCYSRSRDALLVRYSRREENTDIHVRIREGTEDNERHSHGPKLHTE